LIDAQTEALLHLENGEAIPLSNQGNQELLAKETGIVVFRLDRTIKTKLLLYKVVSYTIQTRNITVSVHLNEQQQKSFYKAIDLLKGQAKSVAILD
jgi:environmental stress-induced protein Ves